MSPPFLVPVELGPAVEGLDQCYGLSEVGEATIFCSLDIYYYPHTLYLSFIFYIYYNTFIPVCQALFFIFFERGWERCPLSPPNFRRLHPRLWRPALTWRYFIFSFSQAVLASCIPHFLYLLQHFSLSLSSSFFIFFATVLPSSEHFFSVALRCWFTFIYRTTGLRAVVGLYREVLLRQLAPWGVTLASFPHLTYLLQHVSFILSSTFLFFLYI